MKGRAAVVTILALLVATFIPPAGVSAGEEKAALPAAAASDNQAGPVTDNQAAVATEIQVTAPAPAVAPEAKYPEGLVHEVVAGDTLWDLAAKHLGSPWLWTELWERNRFVTNPHYIYPGIRIEIFPPPPREYEMSAEPVAEPVEAPSGPAPGTAAAPEEPPASPPEATPRKPVLPITPAEFVRAGEFLRERPAGIGTIKDGRESKVAFSENDRVYLSLGKEIPAGQLLGVYRVRGPIPDPAGRSVSGYVRYLAGVIQVTAKENGEVGGVVRTSFEDLSRQDLVSEEIPSYHPVVIDPGPDGLESNVVAARLDIQELAAGEFIYLDKGADAGVGAGNVFRVYNTSERSPGESSADAARVSIEAARAVVVRVTPTHSTAYIVNSEHSFQAGARARRGTGNIP